MYPIARHSVICKWYHVEMLPRCSLSYSSTCILELLFIVTNGQPTTKCNNYLMYSNTALSTTPYNICKSSHRNTHTKHRVILKQYENQVQKHERGHEVMLISYLDEFMWREHHGNVYSLAMQTICRDIALRYPV